MSDSKEAFYKLYKSMKDFVADTDAKSKPDSPVHSLTDSFRKIIDIYDNNDPKLRERWEKERSKL